MTKAQLVDALSLQADIGTKAAATRTIEFVIATIKTELIAGNSVDISGLGKFEAKLQKGKTGTIPGTTKQYTTSDKMIPKFKAAAAFKTAIAEGK